LILLLAGFVVSGQQIGNGFAINISDLTQPIKSGVYQVNSLGVNPDESNSWYHLFVMRHSNESNNHQLQLSFSYSENDKLFFRKLANSSGQNWYEVATRGTNNFSGNQVINGHVGIGTNYPQQKFVVSNNGAEGFEVYLDPAASIVGLQSYNRVANGHSKMQLDASQFAFMYGHVGIGTTYPQQKFVVSNNGAEGFEVYLDPSAGIVGLQSYNRISNGYSKMQIDASQFAFMYGKVGIGIANPKNELDVNGTIHSKEVKVDMLNWPDFVFQKEYNLSTLEEVERHIAEKGHLENIPSEEEVLKNGINLGEMNSKLLQKIEELTLYIIAQDKKTEQLMTFISDQNKIISEQNKRLKKLEEKQ